MVDSKHQWKAWLYLLPAIILLIIFTVWPIINTVATAFIYKLEYRVASIQVDCVGEEKYRFYYTDDEGVKKYMTAVKSEDGGIHLQYTETPDGNNSVFVYDPDLTAWSVNVANKQYFVGATKDSDVDLYEATKENVKKIGSSIYTAALYSGSPNKHITSELDAKAGYNFGLFKGVTEAFKYVLASAEDGILNTTDVLDESAQMWPELCQIGNNWGYKLYVENEDWSISFLNATIAEDGTAVMDYTASSDLAFLYNEANKAWVCTINGTEYYLGLDGANHIAVFPLADIKAENAPSPAAMFMHRGEASEAAETIYLSEDDAYRIGAHRAANGTQTYVTTGNSNINGLMLTEDVVNGEVFSKFGINNFTYVLTSKGSDFMVCLKNTLILTVITVPISTILALLIAVALNSIKPLQRLLQTIFFLPYVTNSIAIGIVFAAMFTMTTRMNNGETVILTAGIINDILGIFNIAPIDWMGSEHPMSYWHNLTVMVIYIVWNALPFKILILLGGLQSVNKQYYDAAKVDGTSKVRTFTHITVPLLSPMIAYVVITGFIGGFKEYTSIVGVFGESMGPTGEAYRLNTMVGYIYKYIASNQGRASAAALILFAIIFAVTLVNLQVSSKKTQY